MKLTCYIVDDEPLAIDVLLSHLEKIERIEVAGTFQNAVKAFEALQGKPVDLIFLDIQMPALTGINLLKSLKNPPKVIFTTAYREYALDGFELDVTDYLLKPISFERFLKAINKVCATDFYNDRLIINMDHQNRDELYFYVQSGVKKVRIRLDGILYIESQRDYVKIKTTEKEISTNQTISYMEENLPGEYFLRIHRSFIVNLNKIEGWSPNEIDLANVQIPIGRTYKNAVVKILNQRMKML